MKNLVLIGMPGAGKTTVGTLLARALGMELIDTDALVVAAAGVSIAALFETRGEAYFRSLERRAVAEAAARRNVILATGGGVVQGADNMETLRRSGVVFFLDRPPEAIVDGDHAARPLIGGDRDRVFALYNARIELYRKYADVIIPNADTPQAAADAILAHWR